MTTRTGWRSAVLAAGLFFGLTAGMAHAANYYVDVSWTGTESGSQTQPYKTIKAAVDAANLITAQHNIYIAGGWYGDVANTGTEDYSAGGGTDGGILLTQRIYFYGGYVGWDGDGTAPSDFDWTAGSRVPRSTIIDLTGANSRAFFSTRNQYAITALYDGLVFQHADHAFNGGAIAHGTGSDDQGFLYIHACLFTNNVTTADGGAIYIKIKYANLPRVTSSHFLNNQAANGGAIRIGYFTTAIDYVEDCLFRNNVATGSGGAIFTTLSAGAGSTYRFTRCRFENNTAGNYGGAYTGDRHVAQFEQCTFIENHAPNQGAAIYVSGDNGVIILKNCLMTGNTGGYAAHANIHPKSTFRYSLIARHCTVVGNSGGGLRAQLTWNSTVATNIVQNSIIVNNGNYGIRREANNAYNLYAFSHNNVYNNTNNYYLCVADANSISADPRFAAVVAGDHGYGLAVGSPSRNTAATNVGIAIDLLGKPRPFNAKDAGFDMGCFEMGPPPRGTLVAIW